MGVVETIGIQGKHMLCNDFNLWLKSRKFALGLFLRLLYLQLSNKKCNPPSVIYNVRYSIVFESSGVSGHFSMDNEVKRS